MEPDSGTRVHQLLLRMLLLAFGYAALAHAGWVTYRGHDGAAVFWPANSLVVVLLCFSPIRQRPVLVLVSALSEALVDRYYGMSWLMGAGLAIANVGESVLAAWLILRFVGKPVRLDALRSLFSFLLVAVLCPAVSANLGALVLYHAGLAPSFLGAWPVWWLGDSMGLLLVFPALLSVAQWIARGDWVMRKEPAARARVSASRIVETLVLVAGLGIALALGVSHTADSEAGVHMSHYLTFPALVWAGLRFGFGTIAWCSLALGIVTAWHIAHGHGPFAASALHSTALSMQAYLAIVSVTALVLAAGVAERKRAEAALRSKQSFIERLTDAVPVSIYVLNCQSGAAEFFSRQSAGILGYSAQEFIALRTDPLSLMHPDDRTRFGAHLKAIAEGKDGVGYEFECRMRHRSGEWRWFTSRNIALERAPDGRLLRLLGAATDITARKQAEEQLVKAHDEKQVLLREVYHRVKNNLQIVSALISLQASRLPEASARRALAQGEARLRSMALVHEQLYRSDNLATIDVADYLGKLLGALGAQLPAAKISVDCHHIALGMDQALPCGLILNELVSNAGQHAFGAGRRGEIWVEFKRAPDDWLTMEVADNGIGLPDEAELTRRNSLGWLLVQSLTTQLGGRLSVQRENGTRVRIDFPYAGQPSEAAA